jgi:hypothetical protein
VGGTRLKEVLGILSGAGQDGGPGKMARVLGGVGLVYINRDNFVCGLGNVDRQRPKEGLGTISRAVWGGGPGKMAR